MTQEFFTQQYKRLQTRFGDRNMDGEFFKLVWAETHSMPDFAFKGVVDVFIGTRTHHKPPLLTDFREARLSFERNNFERDLNGACKILRHPALSTPLHEILAREFGDDVTDIRGAFEKAKRKQHNPDEGA